MRLIVNTIDSPTKAEAEVLERLYGNSAKELSLDLELHNFSVTPNLATFEVVAFPNDLEGLEERVINTKLQESVPNEKCIPFHVSGKVEIREIRSPELSYPGLYSIKVIPYSRYDFIDKLMYQLPDEPEVKLNVTSFDITSHDVTLTVESKPNEVLEVIDSTGKFRLIRRTPLGDRVLYNIHYLVDMGYYVHVSKERQCGDKVTWSARLRYN